MPSTSLDSRASDTPSAAEILARLERYAASKRTATPDAPADPTSAIPTITPPPTATSTVAPPTVVAPVVAPPFATEDLASEAAATETLPDADEHLPHRRARAGSVDLFPYDLAASIVGCAAIIMACIAFGRPVALVFTAAFIAGGEYLRRRRLFPSLGVNLMIGTIVGLLFVLVS